MSPVNLLSGMDDQDGPGDAGGLARYRVLIAVGVVLVAWVSVYIAQMTGLGQQRARIESGLLVAQQQQKERMNLAKTLEELEARADRMQTTRQSVPPAAMLAFLSHMTGEDVLFTSLELARTKPRVGRNATANSIEDVVLSIRIEGRAETGSAVSQLLEKLSSESVVGDVHLEKSSINSTAEGFPREFVIVVALRRSHGATEVADESLDSVSSAFQKTYARNPSAAGVPQATDLQIVDEAIAAARRLDLDPHLRSFVSPHIGPDQAFKSMEEFEALRFMPSGSLSEEQITAIGAIRASIPSVTETTQIRKVMNPGIADGIIDGTNDSAIRGSIINGTDMDDLVGASRAQVRDGLRLDYDDGPLDAGGGYAIVEIDTPSLELVANSRVPKSDGFWTGGNDRLVQGGYPYTGNGFIATVDGKLRPEFHLGDEFVGLPAGARIRKFNDSGSELGVWEYDGAVWIQVQ